MTKLTITSTPLVDSERLNGTQNVILRYLDGRVASFKIYYDTSVRWESSAHFAAAIADQLHLPSEGWRENGLLIRLTCNGFTLTWLQSGRTNSL